MTSRFGVFVVAVLTAYGEPSLTNAQNTPTRPGVQPVRPAVQPARPAVQPARPAVQPARTNLPVQPARPAVQPVRPNVQSPIRVFPSIQPGQTTVQPGQIIYPNQQPGVRVFPSIQPRQPFVQPPIGEPTDTTPPVVAQERIVLHLTNETSQDLTIHVKYLNTDGNVRTLKIERVPTIAPGEKTQIRIPTDIATVRENATIKYLVAVRGISEGVSDKWWGVKAQDGTVEDKDEFVGLRFRSFSTEASGTKTKNLVMPLRERN